MAHVCNLFGFIIPFVYLAIALHTTKNFSNVDIYHEETEILLKNSNTSAPYNLTEISGTQNSSIEREGASLNIPKTRYKRNGEQSKFKKASRMGQLKLFRVWLRIVSNPFVKAPVGGAHPMHINAPTEMVKLFKQRIINFFYPPIGVSEHELG